MKRKFALLLSAALVVSTTTVAMASVTFSDLNDVPWEGAKNYMMAAADWKLMVGEENGDGTNLFRAKDKVTYCEAMQLAYNILVSQGEVSPSDAVTLKWKSAMEGYDIPQWAYEAVAYGLEQEIITVGDLDGFMKGDGSSNNATREDVAVIFGRALNQGKTLSVSSTSYSDNASISTAARPYVAYLQEKKIMVGDDENKFNPKELINRAEMAVLVTKTYSAVSGEALDVESRTVTGTVTDISEKGICRTLTIAPTSGSAKTLTGVKGTPTKNGDFMSIQTGSTITVTYIGDTILSVDVGQTASLSQTDATSGTLNNITTESIVLNLSGGGSKIYELSPSAELYLNGEVSSLSAIRRVLENGVPIDVTVGLSGQTAILVEAQGEEDVVMGTITDLESDRVTIKRNNGNEMTYELERYVRVKLEGSTYSFSNLLDDFGSVELSVTAYLNDGGYVETMEVGASQAGGTARGYVKSISEDKITLSDGDDSTSYKMGKDPYVTYEGADLTLSKLISKYKAGTAFTAKVYLDSSKKVTRIIATLEDDTVGTIEKLTDDYITIMTGADMEKEYLMDEDVVIELKDGKTETLSYLQAVFVPGETKAELQLNGSDEVVKIEVDIDKSNYNVVTGDLSKMGTDSLEVGGKTIYANSDTKVTIDGETSSMSELQKRFKAGESFGVTVAYSDDVANSVQAKLEEVKGRVTQLQKGKVTIALADGTTKAYTVAEDDDLTIRIDGRSTKYTFNEFYSKWYLSKVNFDVELVFEDGVVTYIYADTVS